LALAVPVVLPPARHPLLLLRCCLVVPELVRRLQGVLSVAAGSRRGARSFLRLLALALCDAKERVCGYKG
jgi:hypothetical protein